MKSLPFLTFLLSTLSSTHAQSASADPNAKPASACPVSSAYTFLSSAGSTGSAFCETLLYKKGATTSTITEVQTVRGECKTKTVTVKETEMGVETVYKTKSTTLPTVDVTFYSNSKIVPSGTRRPVGKRQASGSTTSAASSTTTSTLASSSSSTAPLSTSTTAPASTTLGTSTTAAAASPAAVAAPANAQQCAPTPSQLCSCPDKTISSACSSLVPSPTPVTKTKTSTTTVKCPKETTVTTKSKFTSKVTLTTTQVISPAPNLHFAPASVTLTTTVPAACASSAYYGNGNGVGDQVVPLGYPYFPQTGVECCVVCYNYPGGNCVAAAAIGDGAGGLAECDLLVKTEQMGGAAPGCSLGVEDYPFGTPQSDGNVYPGPCGY